MLVPSGYWATYCIVFLARGVAVFLNALPLVLHNVIKFETNELSFVLIFYFIEVLEKLKQKYVRISLRKGSSFCDRLIRLNFQAIYRTYF